MLNLSIPDARKLILHCQRLATVKSPGRAPAATLTALRRLGYVQIDTISVVERAHHHTLWNRNRRHRPRHLDQLLCEKKIFEYWSHAAAYLPMEDYRFSLPQKRAIADGKKHWFARDATVMKKVLQRITADGALRARDFAGARGVGMWDWKPAKRALEQLFMEGKLMTARRRGFDKVYDLTERVLPATVDVRTPGEREHAHFLVTRFLQANGIGRAAEIAYLRGGVKPAVERCIAAMTKRGEVVAVQVGAKVYYALPASLELLDEPSPRSRLKILSPFDNLLIQRARTKEIFGFDYQIECYTPAAKRKHGYFSLPLLWRGGLVARMDCKADRQRRVLIVRNLAGEVALAKKHDAFAAALAGELKHFAAFNGCERIVADKLRDKTMRGLLVAALR